MAKFCKAGIKTGIVSGLFGFNDIWDNYIKTVMYTGCSVYAPQSSDSQLTGGDWL